MLQPGLREPNFPAPLEYPIHLPQDVFLVRHMMECVKADYPVNRFIMQREGVAIKHEELRIQIHPMATVKLE